MAVHYSVHAEVVDIRGDRPKPADNLLVDTNVWLWMAYAVPSQGAAAPPIAPGPAAYSTYFKRLLAAKSKLRRNGLSMAELAHRIEKAQYDLFAATNLGVTSKEFRNNFTTERKNNVADIQSAWNAVKVIATPLDVTIDEPTTDQGIARLSTQALDGYDLFLVEAMAKAGVTQILTDDGDYCTVPGIQVLTANRYAVDAARTQGKLVVR